ESQKVETALVLLMATLSLSPHNRFGEGAKSDSRFAKWGCGGRGGCPCCMRATAQRRAIGFVQSPQLSNLRESSRPECGQFLALCQWLFARTGQSSVQCKAPLLRARYTPSKPAVSHGSWGHQAQITRHFSLVGSFGVFFAFNAARRLRAYWRA